MPSPSHPPRAALARRIPFVLFVTLVVAAATGPGCSKERRAEPGEPDEPSATKVQDPDALLRDAVRRFEAEGVESGVAALREAYEAVSVGGEQPEDVEVLKRLQLLLAPLAPEQADPLLQVNTTLALASLTDLMTAREPLATHVAQSPQAYSALVALGHLAFQARYVDAALMWFGRAVAADPERKEGHHGRGSVLAAKGRPEEALAEFDAILAIDPRDAAAHLYRGRVLAEMERGDEALDAWRRATALEGDPRQRAEAWNRIGGVRLDRGDRDGALEAFLAATELDPDAAPSQLNAGSLLHHLDRPKDARPYLERARELRPEDWRPHLLLAQIAEEQGDDALAEAGYREVLRLEPPNTQARYRLAQLLRRSGRAEEADEVTAGGTK